ncbi:hypothetical protein USDA257_p05140 (plasmid) [Sinorhizobium fredii USDA 257]|uniref:Uncharacterized protein n=1 Tax=Sinorhizobium fredii (strain USDA 257) TaxID=1185652 RepID=I3XH73_SINF2|nr:hypothetical protein USDA257_p05140 [Sinorhizobium fredii USDA 257]
MEDLSDCGRGIHLRLLRDGSGPKRSTVLSTLPSSSVLHDTFRAAGIAAGRVKGRLRRAKLPLTRAVRMRHAVFLSFPLFFLPDFQGLVPVLLGRAEPRPVAPGLDSERPQPLGKQLPLGIGVCRGEEESIGSRGQLPQRPLRGRRPSAPVIPTSAVSDSQGFPRGFESESMQQTGGLRWVQQFCCVMISMGVLFDSSHGKRRMPTRRGGCWRSPRFMTAARARMRHGSAA